MVDTNLIVDIRERDPAWQDWALGAVADARLAGKVAVSAVTIGELAALRGSLDELVELVSALGLAIVPLTADAAHRAGCAQRAYRAAGGKRAKLLGDFLIGGAADSVGATLLTRDRALYRRYFPTLTLITPEKDHG